MIYRFFKKKIIRILVGFALLSVLIYGSQRLYFEVTGGFRVGNITSDLKPDPRWETRPLSVNEQEQLSQILTQSYYYLGKGCQSYVFGSEDGQYVIKFFKYQHFRQKPWLDLFAFIGPVGEYRDKSIAKKKKLFDGFFASWKIGFDHLQKETGIVYVHLNKTDMLNQDITIYDKMGMEHLLEADKMEFLVQKRAEMLRPTINQFMASGEEGRAKQLLTDLVGMIVDEYKRGFVDKDHALMQNTGVYQGRPMHVDVGQFVYDEKAKNPHWSDQELFNQTYKLRLWLQQQHPSLVPHLDKELTDVMGDKFHQLKYIPKVKS